MLVRLAILGVSAPPRTEDRPVTVGWLVLVAGIGVLPWR